MDYPLKTLSQLRPILQGFRKAAGLTQAAMASHLGVTQQTYAQLEANPAAVSVERLFKVLRVLQVDLKLTETAGGASASDATADNVERNTPSTRKQATSTATQQRARSQAKPDVTTTRRKAHADTAREAPRAATKATKATKGAKPVSVGKKRENW